MVFLVIFYTFYDEYENEERISGIVGEPKLMLAKSHIFQTFVLHRKTANGGPTAPTKEKSKSYWNCNLYICTTTIDIYLKRAKLACAFDLPVEKDHFQRFR